MSKLEDKYHDVMGDPKKAARFFKFTWIVAYGMLVLGAIIIVVLLANQYL